MQLFDGEGERILTLQETARLFDYDEDFVRERAEAGGLPSLCVGDELLFSKTALERWILGLKVNVHPSTDAER